MTGDSGDSTSCRACHGAVRRSPALNQSLPLYSDITTLGISIERSASAAIPLIEPTPIARYRVVGTSQRIETCWPSGLVDALFWPHQAHFQAVTFLSINSSEWPHELHALPGVVVVNCLVRFFRLQRERAAREEVVSRNFLEMTTKSGCLHQFNNPFGRCFGAAHVKADFRPYAVSVIQSGHRHDHLPDAATVGLDTASFNPALPPDSCQIV